uniref:Lipoxygenase n=1 Tax=Chenopodium quinoa TaxID=63459 RepID=A0A803KP58_CHEQI
MINLLKCEISNTNLLTPLTNHQSKSNLFSSSTFSLLQSRNLSSFPNHNQSKIFFSLKSKGKAKGSYYSVVKNTLDNRAPAKVIIEGIVVLKKKTLSAFKEDVKSKFVHSDDVLIGGKVSFQLVSAVHTDPANNYKGKLGKLSYLEKGVKTITDLADDELAFRVRFDWDEDIDLPGALITYLPHQTPAPLCKYREEELEILRGEGKDQNEMLLEWDRVYDYAYYNDLGKPDKGKEYVRPIFGGSAEYPYPRRGRTSRPPTKKDPHTESRLPLAKAKDVYVPRDEKFAHLKLSDFMGDTVKSISQGVFGMLDAIFDWTPTKFHNFKEVHDLYEGAIKLQDRSFLDKFRKLVPTAFLKALFRSDGADFLNYPKPDIIKEDESAWRTDEEFTRQMLAGINPFIIRRLEEFPPVSRLDPVAYGNQNSSITKECLQGNLDGLSVEEAMQRNRLFILDHHDIVMPYLRQINTETTSKVYATRTILFLKEDGTLKPLVIELSLPHEKGDKFGAVSELHAPANDGIKASLWQLAKAYVAVNDSAYHQLISHWLHTHAVMEPFIIASNRQLSMLHPIYKLLHPHFRDTMPVNTVARQIALNADGLFEQAVFPRQYVVHWTSSLYKKWALTEQALPRDLIKRGMAVKDSKSPHGYKLLIEDYPYAVDGLQIWGAIETWVKEYCLFYYKTDIMVANDPELQSWWKEIREIGHGDKKDEKWWPEMKTINELTETCTTIIWVASALHAVVNFGQYPYSGHMPNRPTISRRFMPKTKKELKELEKNPDGVFLKTVTSQLRTLACLSVIELISRHSEDEVYLGQREPGWTSDAPPIEAFKRFSKKLESIEKEILDRNKDPELKNRVGPAKLPFTLLCPSSGVGITGRGIPNSVSI